MSGSVIKESVILADSTICSDAFIQRAIIDKKIIIPTEMTNEPSGIAITNDNAFEKSDKIFAGVLFDVLGLNRYNNPDGHLN